MEDYYNKNSIFDVYLLLSKNLNSFSLNRKFTDKTKHEMIYMIWRECMPVEYYRFICEEGDFLYLHVKNVLQPKVLQIIAKFIEKDDKNFKLLQNNLARYKSIFQYVYSNIYPEVYCATENGVFDLESNFHIIFKTYKDKMQIGCIGKNPINYESIRKETNTYEQKPVNIDDFNDYQEAEIKDRVNKQKRK